MARRRLGSLAALLGLALAGCGAIPEQTRDRANCVPYFMEYDQLARFARDEAYDRRRDRLPFDSRLSQLAVLLVQNDCQTRGDDLARLDAVMEARAGAPIVEGGAPLGRAVAIHAGAVTSEAEAARADAFFRGVGLQATSIGSPRLGRRVYAGPVLTVDGLNALIDLARAAGFVAPYPSEYFRF